MSQNIKEWQYIKNEKEQEADHFLEHRIIVFCKFNVGSPELFRKTGAMSHIYVCI